MIKILTVLPGSAVPVKLGAALVVTLSVLEQPESVAAVKSGIEGAAGGVVSMVTLRAEDASELEAVADCLAVML